VRTLIERVLLENDLELGKVIIYFVRVGARRLGRLQGKSAQGGV
jgi:hypothetical protein